MSDKDWIELWFYCWGHIACFAIMKYIWGKYADESNKKLGFKNIGLFIVSPCVLLISLVILMFCAISTVSKKVYSWWRRPDDDVIENITEIINGIDDEYGSPMIDNSGFGETHSIVFTTAYMVLGLFAIKLVDDRDPHHSMSGMEILCLFLGFPVVLSISLCKWL